MLSMSGSGEASASAIASLMCDSNGDSGSSNSYSIVARHGRAREKRRQFSSVS